MVKGKEKLEKHDTINQRFAQHLKINILSVYLTASTKHDVKLRILTSPTNHQMK
jgi:hypothetical protein